MNALFAMELPLSEIVVERLGWVLVHSLWQFALVALLVGITMRAMRKSSAKVRYVALIIALTLTVAAPVVTVCSLPALSSAAPSDSGIASQNGPESLVALDESSGPSLQSDSLAASSRHEGEQPEIMPGDSSASTRSRSQAGVRTIQPPERTASWSDRAATLMRPWLAWIVAVWSFGVVICSLRPLLGWHMLWRLKHVGVLPVPGEVLAAMRRVSTRLGVRYAVRVLQSTLARVPVVVGYVRPVILLPVSLMTNLPTSQLEAILAHELAHVMRHDFVVNLLQTLVETLFFYHPAVWWMSHQLRIEREHCCDDLVVAALENRVEYGRALIAVAELHGRSTLLAPGMSDGSLLSRLRRIVGSTGSEAQLAAIRQRNRWPVALACLAAVGLVTALSSPWNVTARETLATQKRLDKYVAELAGGLQVEFVGLAPMGSESKGWWKPDGTALEPGPADKFKTSTSISGLKMLRAVLRVHGAKNYLDVTTNMTSSRDLDNRDPLKPVVTIAGGLAFAPTQSSTIVEVGIATQPLSPIRVLDPTGKKLPPAPDASADHIAEDIEVVIVVRMKSSNPRTADDARERTAITFVAPVPANRQFDLDLKLIDTDGKAHAVKQISTNGPSAPRNEMTYVFDVPFQRVSRFEYQMRPYHHWVTFENVSLIPGNLTDVKVVTASHNSARAGAVIERGEAASSRKDQALQQAEALADVFWAALQGKKLEFVSERQLEALRQELSDELAGHLPGPVDSEWFQKVLQAVDLYCNDVHYRRFTFPKRFMTDFEVLKWQLWTAMDRDQLTRDELARRESQRQWFRDFVQTLPNPYGTKVGEWSTRVGGKRMATTLEYKLDELEEMMTDPLNPHFSWPLTDSEFQSAQNGVKNQSWLVKKADIAFAPGIVFHAVAEVQRRRVENRWPLKDPAASWDGFGKSLMRWDRLRAARPLSVFDSKPESVDSPASTSTGENQTNSPPKDYGPKDWAGWFVNQVSYRKQKDGSYPAVAFKHLRKVVTEDLSDEPNAPGATEARAWLEATAPDKKWTAADFEAMVERIGKWRLPIIQRALGDEETASRSFPKPGRVATPEELQALSFGPAAENGLRVAWVLVPAKGEYKVGDDVACRVVFHNTGAEPVQFAAWDVQDGTWTIRDAVGRALKTEDLPGGNVWTYPKVGAYQRYRLDPGQVVEVGGQGFGIGAVEHSAAKSQIPIWRIIHAQRDDSVQISVETKVDIALRFDEFPEEQTRDWKGNLHSGELKFRVVAAASPDGELPVVLRPKAPTIVLPDHLNVMAVRFADEGRELITMAMEHDVTIRRWDVARKELKSEVKLETKLHGNQFLSSQFQFSDDRRMVIGIDDDRIGIWETATGKLVKNLGMPESLERKGLYGLSSTPNLARISCGVSPGLSGLGPSPARAIVWDLPSSEVLQNVQHQKAIQIHTTALSRDGQWLAAGGQPGGAELWETSSGIRRHTWANDNPGRKHPDPEVSASGANQVLALAFSPDGRWLALGDMLGVKLLDVKSGEVQWSTGAPFRFGRSALVFSEDGKMLARTQSDKVVPIWSTQTGKLLAELPTEAHDGAFSDDGKWFAVGFSDGKQALAVWQLLRGGPARTDD